MGHVLCGTGGPPAASQSVQTSPTLAMDGPIFSWSIEGCGRGSGAAMGRRTMAKVGPHRGDARGISHGHEPCNEGVADRQRSRRGHVVGFRDHPRRGALPRLRRTGGGWRPAGHLGCVGAAFVWPRRWELANRQRRRPFVGHAAATCGVAWVGRWVLRPGRRSVLACTLPRALELVGRRRLAAHVAPLGRHGEVAFAVGRSAGIAPNSHGDVPGFRGRSG